MNVVALGWKEEHMEYVRKFCYFVEIWFNQVSELAKVALHQFKSEGMASSMVGKHYTWPQGKPQLIRWENFGILILFSGTIYNEYWERKSKVKESSKRITNTPS